MPSSYRDIVFRLGTKLSQLYSKATISIVNPKRRFRHFTVKLTVQPAQELGRRRLRQMPFRFSPLAGEGVYNDRFAERTRMQINPMPDFQINNAKIT